MTELQIDIPTADGTADAVLFLPESGGPFPVLIYETDVRGISSAFMIKGRRLADAGYAVLMPNLFYRLTKPPMFDPTLAWGTDAFAVRLAELLGNITTDGLYRDHVAFLSYLDTVPNLKTDKVAVAGYCLGGAVALHVAADFPDRIAAAASFHGGRLVTDLPDSPHLKVGRIKARLYLGYAENDQFMTEPAIVILEAALTAAHVAFETDRNAAGHGYALTDSLSYDKQAEALHWKRLLDLLAETIGPGRA